MNSCTERPAASLYLLVGVLLFVASGALMVAPHDHDLDEYCRACSLIKRAEAQAGDQGTDAPRLETSTPSTTNAPVARSTRLLAATPLRGPPLTS